MSWYQYHSGILTLYVYVQPGAKHSEIVGLFQNELKIKLAAPPIDGQANNILIKFLSKLLDLPKSSIYIKKGEKSRHKCLLISSKQIPLDHWIFSLKE